MRHLIVSLLLVPAAAIAVELPKFELDVNRWRQSAQSAPGARKQIVAYQQPPRCAIPLREVQPLPETRIQIVTPDREKRFAMNEAKLPAESCPNR